MHCEALPIPTGDTFQNIDESVTWLNEALNECAQNSLKTNRIADERWNPQQERWNRLLERGDSKEIWQAIGWSGSLKDGDNNGISPSDNEFKIHFETLLNPNPEETTEIDVSESPYVPLLDDPFNPNEVHHAIRKVKNKGYLGVATGLFRWISQPLLFFITELLSLLLTWSSYPSLWCYNITD